MLKDGGYQRRIQRLGQKLASQETLNLCFYLLMTSATVSYHARIGSSTGDIQIF